MAKFLSPVLFTTFVHETLTQDSGLCMASLDVDAFITNIPLDDIIDICVKQLFQTSETLIKEISENDFCNLLNLATKESFFIFNNKFHIQVDGVSMWSLLGPLLDIISLSHHEENWLNKCPTEFKPNFYRRYFDDIFVLFKSPESAHLFHKYVF